MLREIPPFDVDGGSQTFMTAPGDEETRTSVDAFVDPLDDVFGSAPTSPALPAQASENNEDAQLDVFGSVHPSDVPRLRSTHVTNGYREGIAASKEKFVQEGFDEGYALGAELGLKAGWCLGVLEGLLRTEPRAEASSAGGGYDGGAGSGEDAVTGEKL